MAQNQSFTGTARRIIKDGFFKKFFYHDTCVVERDLHTGNIRLHSGGWRTTTTLRAMNQASNQDGFGFYVHQRKGEWYVKWNGLELSFYDGMVLQ